MKTVTKWIESSSSNGVSTLLWWGGLWVPVTLSVKPAVALFSVRYPNQADQEGRSQMKRDAEEKGTSIQIILMLEAVTPVMTWNMKQMMLEVVHACIASDVTRVVWMPAVLWCGKWMEKVPHYYFSWVVSFQKQRQIWDAPCGNVSRGSTPTVEVKARNKTKRNRR